MANPRKCRGCGKEFTPRHAGTFYCSDACRPTKAQVRARYGAPVPPLKGKCPVCGEYFMMKNTRSRFCSSKCRLRWSRTKQHIKEEPLPNGWRRCAVCQKPFTPEYPRHVYCSQECIPEG